MGLLVAITLEHSVMKCTIQRPLVRTYLQYGKPFSLGIVKKFHLQLLQRKEKRGDYVVLKQYMQIHLSSKAFSASSSALVKFLLLKTKGYHEHSAGKWISTMKSVQEV
jgi:hydrogenase maturation factor